MDFDLTPEQDDLIRRAIERGRISRREDALHEAVQIWVKLEQIRDDFLAAFDRSKKVELDDKAHRAAIDALFHLALGAASAEIDDDPFVTFDEWQGDADRKAYADL